MTQAPTPPTPRHLRDVSVIVIAETRRRSAPIGGAVRARPAQIAGAASISVLRAVQGWDVTKKAAPAALPHGARRGARAVARRATATVTARSQWSASGSGGTAVILTSTAIQGFSRCVTTATKTAIRPLSRGPMTATSMATGSFRASAAMERRAEATATTPGPTSFRALRKFATTSMMIVTVPWMVSRHSARLGRASTGDVAPPRGRALSAEEAVSRVSRRW